MAVARGWWRRAKLGRGVGLAAACASALAKCPRVHLRASHACYSTRAPVPPCAPAWTEVEDENDEGMLVF